MRALVSVLALLILSSPAARTGTISVPVPECAPVLEADSQGQHIRAPHYCLTGSPGDPELPFKEIHVVLPPNVDPSSVIVTVTNDSVADSPAERGIAPVPPIVTVVDGKEVQDWGENKDIRDGRNMLVYGQDAFYPLAHAGLAGVGDMRKWRLVRVRYYPYLYNPVAQRLERSQGGQIEISYSLMMAVESAGSATPDDVLTDTVAQLAVNFSEARNWYFGTTGPVRLFGQADPQPATNYVIITTAAIAAGSTKLTAFVNHKTARGFGVAVVTESQWGGGTGDAAANNIRSYLKANYLTKGYKYVLMIGDPNPTSGTVPMKMLWPRKGSTTYREAPSDYFYADLTGNWDLDRDNYYGEGDNDLGPGGCDLYPEVIVGRIPFYGAFTDLDSILQKVIDYESGAIGGSWVRNVLLTMKPSDANTPGYNLGEAIRNDAATPVGITTTRVYEQTYGLNPAPDITPCTYSTVLTGWKRHAGFWFWWTHGNETLAADIVTTSQTVNLDDHYPSFTFQCSCLNAYPENPANLAYALLKRGAIATNAATRVSWYYPGQIDFTNTDSNAGMTYRYAVRLVRDHMPCGDAHYQMMLDVPLDIWMNHLVFNIYGDPSVAYAAGPTITHTPLGDTDITTQPYVIDAQVVSNGPLKPGNPALKWNTNGGLSFTTAQMILASGTTYRAQIPAQPYGTTVYYYIHAEDVASRVGDSPAGAPGALHSFAVRTDSQAPTIVHTPLSNTGDTMGPYVVRATVTDNTGLSGVTLAYHRNAASDLSVAMTAIGSNVYEGQIPGPSAAGDVISYRVTATDSSLNHNTSRDPSTGYYTFSIPPRRQIAILNSTAVPPCFTGSNSNAHQQVASILNADPAQRFQATVVTSLTAADLSGKDALVLPDNSVPSADSQSVVNWFIQGKTILTMESSTSYAACSGFLWPNASGTNGLGIYWDTNAAVNDQEIVLEDPITSGYALGEVIESRGYTASFITSMLPADVQVLSKSKNNPARAYAVYRDVPGKGRIVALGPYVQPLQSQYSMIREALAISPTDKSILLTSPTAGAAYEVGQTVTVRYRTSGYWISSDRVKLEYTTGLDTTWRQITGAQSLLPGTVSFLWSTAGLPGSDTYKIRARAVNGTSSAAAGPFTITQVLSIAEAKSLADGAVVKLKSKVVTCVGDAYYVQEPTRMAGLKVRTAQALPLATSVTLVGEMTTVNGERSIDVASATAIAGTEQAVPLLMKASALGGGAFGGQQAVVEYRKVRSGASWSTVLAPAYGLNNIGLLVRIAGKVTSVGSDYFYLDDGSNCSDGSGSAGVKVLCGGFAKPAVNTRLAATGISSTYYDRGCLWRALLVTSQSSLQILQ